MDEVRRADDRDAGGSAGDATDRARAEELRSWLSAIVDSSDDAIISKTLDGVITSWNRAAERIFGYPAAEAVGQHIFLIIPDDRRDEEADVLARVRRGERIDHFETLRQAKGGRKVNISLTVSPVRNAAGKIIGASKVARDITSAKQAEQTQLRLAAIVDSSDDAIVSKTLDGVITSWNKAAERIFGYTAAEAVGQHIFLIIPDDRRDEEADVLARLRRGERIDHFETVRQAKGGRKVNISLTVSPLKNAAGKIIGASKVARDITEVKQGEQSQLRLAAIVDSSDDAILSKTLDGVITSWNKGAERIFGYTAAEAVGQHIFLIIPPDRRDEEIDVLARLRRGERIDHFETVRHAKGGRVVLISLTVSPLKDGTGKIIGASKVARDITHIKLAEAALRETEDRFRTMADSSPIIMWMTDMAGRVEFANRAYREFFNVEPRQVINFDWGSTLHPDDAGDYVAAFTAAVAEKQPFFGRARIRRADGKWRWIESRGFPRIDAVGRAVGFALSSPDITEIYESREALKEIDRKKNEFLATLAHELRNPLAPARNSLQIMRMARHDPDIMERALGTMERQIAHMVRLIDDLVDVSRISRGVIELRRERIDLAGVLHNAVEASRPLIDQFGHSLSLKLPAEPVFVEGDAVRLAQVFSNLLNNAAKYTGKGGRIHLTVTRRGGEVIVRVEDNGVGIPTGMLSQVFEMFAQVDRSLDRYSGGLGIGLSIVKRLVEMHDGTVEAHSEGAGRGTEMVVRLPVAMTPGDSRRLPEPKQEIPAPMRRRILIAEDNEDTASSLATILRIMGNEVRTVGNGLEAVAKGRSFQPDVVLLDIGMPKLNGYEACRLIRAEPWGSSAVIIALTGWGQEEDRQLAAEVGFDHYLVKPVETAALAKLLGAGRAAAHHSTSGEG